MFTKWFVCAVLLVLSPVQLLISEVHGDKQTDEFVPCEKGWFYFGGKCYKIFATLQNWHDASKYCESHGGHLATIQSKEVQEFIFVFLLLEEDIKAWIGLNDIRNETHYIWDDGTEYNYSNWNTFEPTGWKDETEDCVEMLFLVPSGKPGEWNDINCAVKLPYICQVVEGKQRGKSPDPTLCPSAKGGGWKYGSSCYNIVKENMVWEDAEKYCQDKYKGHLLMTLNFKVEYFLKYMLSNFKTDIWIGIKIKDEFQQQFSSGWYVAYNNWRKTPQNFVDGTCVIRTKENVWESVSCGKKHPFICETSTDSPPVLKKPPEGSKCLDDLEDWRDLGGEFCYFIDTTSNFNWYRANFECNRRGGSLVSIHSKAELDALTPFVKYSSSTYQKRKIFIGHYRKLSDENVFVWADGSEMDYTNWGDDEPSNREEKCGEMLTTNMKWNDADCGETKGYICSVRKISPIITKTEEESDCINGVTFRTLIGATVCIVLVVILLSVVIYYFRLWDPERRKKSTVTAIPLQTLEPTTLQQMYRSSYDQRRPQVTENEDANTYEVTE